MMSFFLNKLGILKSLTNNFNGIGKENVQEKKNFTPITIECRTFLTFSLENPKLVKPGMKLAVTL